MSCPECGSDRIAIHVPPDLRMYVDVDAAPDAASDAHSVAVCPGCLRVWAADGETAVTATPAAVHDAIPEGDGGVAFLLACGKLGSLALNRAAIVDLFEYAEAAGVDVYLTLSRLSEPGDDPQPHFDASRRLTQIDEFL